MKKVCLLVALSGCLAGSAVRAQDLFAGIQDWVGTGDNEAAMVIDWNNGTVNDTLIWGYRWDGTATGEQMFDAVIAADPRLYAEVSAPDFDTGFGTAVFGFGFHPGADQNFQLSPSLNFNNEHLAYVEAYGDVNYMRTAVTPGDLWQEGFDNTGYPGDPDDGYWALFSSTDSRLTADPSDWDSDYNGITGATLNNDDVDGWVFAFNGGQGDQVPAAPVDVAPAPEPSTWAFFLGSGFFLVCLNRNRRVQKTA